MEGLTAGGEVQHWHIREYMTDEGLTDSDLQSNNQLVWNFRIHEKGYHVLRARVSG